MTAYAPAIVLGIFWWTPGDVGHFEIDLGKFGLSVLASVLVAETPGKLEIFVDCTGTNEELLRLLRGLWERVKEGWMIGIRLGGRSADPGWDEELASTLWRGFEQEGGFDFEKA